MVYQIESGVGCKGEIVSVTFVVIWYVQSILATAFELCWQCLGRFGPLKVSTVVTWTFL